MKIDMGTAYALSMLLAIVAIFGTAYASACTLGVTWVAPAAYENGTPLPASQIARYEIRCTGIGVSGSVVKFAKGGTRGYRIQSAKLPAGQYSCTALTHTVDGRISRPAVPVVGACR